MSETPETPSASDGPSAPGIGGVSRRAAVKAGAAAGVGAIVWAEPTIRGLARRPAYASSTSADLNPHEVTLTGTFDANGMLVNGDDLTSVPALVEGFPVLAKYQDSPADGPRIKMNSPRLRFDTTFLTPVFSPTIAGFGFGGYSNLKRMLVTLPTDPADAAGMTYTITLQLNCLPA